MYDRENKMILEMLNISKSFPGVQALKDVNFNLKSGEVHALVGENGAGKSTLVKILGGVHKPDEGKILIDGREVSFSSPIESRRCGISVIYQELSLVSELNVAQNIFLGKEKVFGPGVIKWHEIYDDARELLNRLSLNIDTRTLIKELTVGMQQMIEIAKSLNEDSRIIIMDEPTSALGMEEKIELFKHIEYLKRKGVGIIYISHRLPEIFEIADRVTVLRDGQHIATMATEEVNEIEPIKMMIGRSLDDRYSRKNRYPKNDKPILEVRNLTRYGVFENISFSIYGGQVLGFYGLMGAGRTEILKCIFGSEKWDEGEIFFDGELLNFEHPRSAIQKGMGFVPEDRKKDGLVLLMSVKDNLSLPSLPWISDKGWIDKSREEKLADQYIEMLNIITPSKLQRVMYLSGGNQQKVCLGKWLARNSRVLLLDEPTRGIDVGAKAEIYKFIEELVRHNVAILMVSSELPEILGLSDNIIVIHEGKITGQYNYKTATQQKLMQSAIGIKNA